MRKMKLLMSIIAILTMVIVAYAESYKNKLPKSEFLTSEEWGIESEDATYYYLSENVTGETQGVTYFCDFHTSSKCVLIVESSNIQIVNGRRRVLKSQVTIIINNGKWRR